MPNRTNYGYTTFLVQFADLVLVSCPSCQKQATICVSPSKLLQVSLICSACGYNRRETVSQTSLGLPTDPYLGLPLWLVTDCGAHQLWAYNLQHLQFLKSHVEAELRERTNQPTFNASIGSRLPKWMMSKKNRKHVIKAIARLEKRITHS